MNDRRESFVRRARCRFRGMFAVAAALSIVIPTATPAQGQPASPASPIDLRTTPTDVTVYRGRASVTRRTTVSLDPGVFLLRFHGLPHTVRADSLQARVGGGGKVLGVEYIEGEAPTASAPAIADLDRRLEEQRRALEAIERARVLVQRQEQFIDAVSVRVTAAATDAGGTPALDLDAVREQFAFVTEERARLMERRRELDDQQREGRRTLERLETERAAIAGSGTINRAAEVMVAVTAAGQMDVELVYLVSEAEWQPSYNVRAATDGSGVTLEFDALLVQRTGETWGSVAMTLSTAQPTIAASPPDLTPWYVDVVRPAPPSTPSAARMPPRKQTPDDDAGFDRWTDETERLERLASDAEVAGTGPSVTFVLPRRVTVETDARTQQRTRIATLPLTPSFVHVARPLLTEAVYIRGELTNASAYQLLPGPAAIFVGSDYVGPTHLGSVAPGTRFDLFFGIDPAVTASRQLVTKETAKTGLLGGGRRTSYAYRIAIANGAGKSIDLELWDRIPVSRAEQIDIQIDDLSHPLDTAALYLEEDRPRGLLKWKLTIPPSTSAATATVVTYTVRVVHPRDLEMTPLPE